MLETTKGIINAILEADSTISPQEKEAVFDVLSGKVKASAILNSNATVMPTDQPDMVLSRKQVATLLGKGVGSVDHYGRLGIIRRVYLTGGGKSRRQSQGYSRASVMEVIKNGATK